MNITLNTIENIYDKYSPMIYGIALDISSTQSEAESILISTFHKAYKQNLIKKSSHFLCASLIKLTIQTAREQLKTKNIIKIKQFENASLLHNLLCDQLNLEDFCSENNLSRNQLAKQIREELSSKRNTLKGNSFLLLSGNSLQLKKE